MRTNRPNLQSRFVLFSRKFLKCARGSVELNRVFKDKEKAASRIEVRSWIHTVHSNLYECAPPPSLLLLKS